MTSESPALARSVPESSAPSPAADSRLAWTLFTLTALLLGYLSLRLIETPDLWWHLSMGRATLEAGSATYPDPVAVSSSGDYVNIVWLFDVPLYLVYRTGGLVAVNLCVALLTMASYLFLFLLALEVASGTGQTSSRIVSPWLPLMMATLVAGATHLRFIPRPQAVFLTLLPLVLWLAWRASRLRGRSQILHLLVLLLIVFLWARMHASVVIAPLVIAATSIRLPLRLVPFERPELSELWPKLSRAHWLTLVVTAILPLTGPSRFDLIRRVLEHGENFAVRHIAEMKPMTLDLWFAPTRDIFFAEVVAVLALVGLWRRRSVDVSCLCLAGLGLYLTLGTNRFSSAWAVMMLPMVVQGLSGGVQERSGSDRRGMRLLTLLTVLAVVALLSLSSTAPTFEVGPVFREQTPQAVADLVEDGVIYNDYDLGGFLGLELYGRPRVLIDSRSQMHFSVEEHYSAWQALRQPEVFSVLDRLHAFSGALVPRSAPLCRSLQQDPSWLPAWFSETRVLFLPVEAVQSVQQARSVPDVSVLDPCSANGALERCRSLGAATALPALESMRTVTPHSAYLARQAVLMELQCKERPDLAAAAAGLTVAATDPEHADFHWLEGMFHLAQGQIELAERALALAPEDHLAAQTLRLQILRRDERSADALPLARRLVLAYEDQDMPRLRELLAWACEEQGDLDCALREALRAAQSGEPAARERLARLFEQGRIPAELLPQARAILELPGQSGSTP